MKALSGVPTALLGLALIGSQPAAGQTPAPKPIQPAKPASDLELPFEGLTAKGDAGFTITHTGPEARAIAGFGFYGVFGASQGTGGRGVFGTANGSRVAGVVGIAESENGGGVWGMGFSGVVGNTTHANGSGVWGGYKPGAATGFQTAHVFGESSSRSEGRLGSAFSGAEGFTNLSGGYAVVGQFGDAKETMGYLANAEYGVYGRNGKMTEGMLGTKENGVVARHGKTTEALLAGAVNAVVGKSIAPGGKGIAGEANTSENAVGVYGASTVGMAGFFRGKVTITDRLLVARIDAQEMYATKGLIGGLGKMFKIDHPLEPAEKYLWHASVESDDRKNMYDGVVTLDNRGTGWITLPDWFQALNKDFRYQLTCIGGYAPVYIAEEIRNNRFRIAGGKAGLRVSWQVTGVRQDPLAKANPFKVEEAKRPADRGRYLNPSELGFPASLGISQPGTPVPSIAPSPR